MECWVAPSNSAMLLHIGSLHTHVEMQGTVQRDPVSRLQIPVKNGLKLHDCNHAGIVIFVPAPVEFEVSSDKLLMHSSYWRY